MYISQRSKKAPESEDSGALCSELAAAHMSAAATAAA